MISTFLQLQADTLAQAIPTVDKATAALTNEVSVLEFIFKGGLFLIPIAILLFYTIYLVFERYLYIHKAAKIDNQLMKDISNHLNNANIEMAVSSTERSGNSQGAIIKEGVLTIGRPIGEIESNMERAANIEIGYMEKKLGQLFCDHSAQQIVEMLLKECELENVTILKEFIIKSITKIVQTTDEIQESECIPNKPCKPLSRMLQ